MVFARLSYLFLLEREKTVHSLLGRAEGLIETHCGLIPIQPRPMPYARSRFRGPAGRERHQLPAHADRAIQAHKMSQDKCPASLKSSNS